MRSWKTFYGVVGDLSEDDRRIENNRIIPTPWLDLKTTTPKEEAELDFNASMLSTCVTSRVMIDEKYFFVKTSCPCKR
jgi:hypothetical protein